jgi:hypothetical protein
MVSGEDEDSGDDDTGSRYDTVTYPAHVPDMRPLLEPIGGLTSRASREASGPVEGEREPGEREVPERVLQREELPRLGPCKRGRWRRSCEPDLLGLNRWWEQRCRR